MRDQGYLLDNQHAEAAARFDALSALFDRWTFGRIDGIGIRQGWRCWEVGAGGPSVASWLADRVGPAGYVLATDLDVTGLQAIARPGVEVRRHDVGDDPPPGGAFDLVHARLVLMHVAPRAAALRMMAGALRPGGWLVVEDADPTLQPLACPDEHGPEERLANRIRSTFRALLAERGAELAYGRTLPRVLREAGLVDVAAEGFFPLSSRACAELERTTIEQVRARLVTRGLVTEDEIAQHLAHVASGRLDLALAPLVSAWGRRPEAPHDNA